MGTLLSIVQSVCNELGLIEPSAVVGATDLQTVQLYSLANREGNELLKVHDWTFLQKLFIINVTAPVQVTGTIVTSSAVITNISPNTTGITANTFVCSGNAIPTSARVVSVDSSSQVTLDSESTGDGTGVDLTFSQDTYPLPSDIDRHIDATQWDRTNRWPLLGPSSPQEDEWHRSGVVTVGPRRHFRQIGIPPNAFRYWPPPGVGETPLEFGHEYVSNGWVNVSGAGTSYATSFTSDSDVPLFGDQAVIMGIKWRFWQIKQFDYAPLQAEYRDYVDQLIGMDGPKGTLSLSRRRFNPLITPATVQDGFFPSGVNTANG